MKVEIEQVNNGFKITYLEGIHSPSEYVYRSIDDLIMLEDVAKRFLKRRVKIEEK